MSDLRALFSGLGFSDVQTVLQSGNVVFAAGGQTASQLETSIEAEIARRLKLPITVLVRSGPELKKIVARNPFPAEAQRDPARFVLVTLKGAPDGAAVKALQGSIVGPEALRADGKQLYVVYPDGQGRSKLTSAVIEKKLGTRGTARNWNTVVRLASLIASE